MRIEYRPTYVQLTYQGHTLRITRRTYAANPVKMLDLAIAELITTARYANEELR